MAHPKGKRDSTSPAWGRHFDPRRISEPIRAVSCRAEPCYLATFISSSLRTQPTYRHFSLIINGESPNAAESTNSIKARQEVKLQPASGHERLNISCSSSRRPRNKLKNRVGKIWCGRPQRAGRGSQGSICLEAGRAAPSPQAPGAPQSPQPCRLHNLGCCSSGLLCSL